MECPRCGEAAKWSGVVMDSIPQGTSIVCPKCGRVKLYSSYEGGGWTESVEEAEESWRNNRGLKRRQHVVYRS
jgi:predicted RNA-binding Zn-ribbon protein involved in translation (DUF1610 family)